MTPERQTKSKSAPPSPDAEALMEANKDMVNTFTDAAKELINAALRPRSNPQESSQDKSTTLGGDERVSVLTGFEFKPTLPKLEDSKPDFDEHWARYKSTVDTLSLNKSKTRMPWDLLQWYEKFLPASRIRLTIYNTHMTLARSRNRVPHDAKAVLGELKDKLRGAIELGRSSATWAIAHRIPRVYCLAV